MIIITIFQLENKIENGKKIFFCSQIEDLIPCPECSEELEYRDSVFRIFKVEGGKKNNLLIRRLQCCNCSRIHRELPDFLAPYKHYTTEVIENVVDEIINSSDFDYPCEKTMQRWKDWILKNKDRINGHLKSVAFRILNFNEELLRSSVCLLSELQKEGEEWLGKILRVIYNSGRFLPP